MIYLDNAATTLHKLSEIVEAVKEAILTAWLLILFRQIGWAISGTKILRRCFAITRRPSSARMRPI